jgi:hypothetical protein
MITFEQIEADINSGKCTKIFFSAKNFWWTHEEADLDTAREVGLKKRQWMFEEIENDNSIPERTKEDMRALRNMAQATLPLDLDGCPLMEIDNVKQWLSEIKERVANCGKYGLRSFMMAHHQNCQGVCTYKWIAYDELIAKMDAVDGNSSN